MQDDVIERAKAAKEAARQMQRLSNDERNRALSLIAGKLEQDAAIILAANATDCRNAAEKNLPRAFIDRLRLNPARIGTMTEGLRSIAQLPNPLGNVLAMQRRPNNLEIGQITVPLGVIAVIFEARPNVTADAVGLGLKAGNTIVLRGGKEAINTNIALIGIIKDALKLTAVPDGAVQLIESTDRHAVETMLGLNEYIDVIIPRGGEELIRFVREKSTIPVIANGGGNCHIYVDREADTVMAGKIIINAKTSRPAVCNAVETILLHQEIAAAFLPVVAADLRALGVELRGCEKAREIVPDLLPATEDDWRREYLDLILAVKIVDSFASAISHIARYGTGHSEAIITENYRNARQFLQEVDAAAVYVNASTRFTDGYEFGFGAEIGISTQKLHARGPLGLNQLTTTKYIIYGDGQIRA